MERLLLGELMKWREKTDRKPLILRGARQVGKTWLLKEFGRKCFRDVCYINFEIVQSCKDTFFGNPETSCQYSKLQIIIRLQRLTEQSPNQ